MSHGNALVSVLLCIVESFFFFFCGDAAESEVATPGFVDLPPSLELRALLDDLLIEPSCPLLSLVGFCFPMVTAPTEAEVEILRQ